MLAVTSNDGIWAFRRRPMKGEMPTKICVRAFACSTLRPLSLLQADVVVIENANILAVTKSYGDFQVNKNARQDPSETSQ